MNYTPKILKSKLFWYGFILLGMPLFLGSYLVFYEMDTIRSNPQVTDFGYWYMFLTLLTLGGGTIIMGISELIKLNIPEKIIRMPIKEKPLTLTKWRERCLERDKHQCIYCNDKNKLEVHHLTPRSIFPELKVNLLNGVTVCKLHHQIAADIFRRLQRICIITAKGE